MEVYKTNKRNISNIDNFIKKNTPVIIVKNFINKTFCREIIKYCVKVSKDYSHRKLTRDGNFFSTDIHPPGVKTDRVFRKYMLGRKFVKKFNKVKDIIKFQKEKIIKSNKNDFKSEIQVVQYPRGGGYFAEHTHKRFPTNYGMIITLSEKGKDFKKGVTNIKFNKKYINLEKHNITCGDLILFRFDLPHKITPVDPDKYLSFDKKGRWTLLFSIAPKHLSLTSY